jgi:type II secretory ATPase GspE/PulE/Tfp pilus assembly ATPase PilB-like protein
MISEIRDLDTGQLALRAALSGVLVFTTLPTMDATSAVLRLIDLGLEPYLVASGLLAVIAQRLVRVVCSECKTPVTHGSDILAKIGLTPDPGFVLYQGRGCERCGATGCRGRTGVFEVLTVDPGMQALIRQRADVSLLRSAAIEAGMKTLFDDALSKAIFGQTTIEEVLRVARSVED